MNAKPTRSPLSISLTTVAIVASLVILAVLLVLASDFLFALFGAVLFGVVLRRLSCLTSRVIPITPRWCAIALILIVGATGLGLAIFSGNVLVDNADELIGEVKTQAASVNQAFTAKFGSLSNANFEQLASNSSGQTLAIAQRFAASMAGGSLNTIFIVIVGCFFAVDPKTYHDGFVRFFPRENRSRVEDILEKCRAQLEAWILGQLLAMSIIGVLVGLGLAVIGVPFAALLGLFAGVVSFVPNLGAIVAILPALLLASSQGTPTVLTVLVLYLVVQFLESNFLTPLVQQQQTSLPPALILSAQLIAGALFGLLGVMFITPVLAVSVVLVEHLYLSKRDQGKSVLLKQMPSQTDMGQTDMGQTDMGQTDMGQTEAAGS